MSSRVDGYDPWMSGEGDLPLWASAFLRELPGTSERVADVLGLEDDEAMEGLVHLAAQDWVVRLAGRGSGGWYPVGPGVAADAGRAIADRVLALLPATTGELRGDLPGLSGRQLSSALNDQRRAGRIEQIGEVWHWVTT